MDTKRVAIEESNAKVLTADSFLIKKEMIPVTKGIQSNSSGKV